MGAIWLLAAQTAAAHAAQGIASRLNLPLAEALLEQAMLLFLLLAGFTALNWIATRTEGVRAANALLSRPTSRTEFRQGVALGWGLLLLATVPMVLAGALHPDFTFSVRNVSMACLSLLTLLLASLALEVAFRGYVFVRLIAAVGPTIATLILSSLYAIASSFRPHSTSLSVAVTFLTGLLFSMAYLRTHALWLGWGLHFAWNAACGVLLGLPVAGYTTYGDVVDTTSTGPDWLTGGAYGPEGAVVTGLVLLVGLAVLYRLSRDYAWRYTHAPIVAAGYAVVVAPPAAHTAMESAAAAAPAPLVQILSSTPAAASTSPQIQQQLQEQLQEQQPTALNQP